MSNMEGMVAEDTAYFWDVPDLLLCVALGVRQDYWVRAVREYLHARDFKLAVIQPGMFLGQ